MESISRLVQAVDRVQIHAIAERESPISLLALGWELFHTSGGLLHSLAPGPFHPGASHSRLSASHDLTLASCSAASL